MANLIFQLVVRRGPQEGHIYPLTGDIMTIGRDPMSEVVISDPEVSRQHARLTRNADGRIDLQDLGSTNGTFVDGNRLGGDKVTLTPGQVVVVGSNVTLVFEAVVDQLATVVSSREDLHFDEAPVMATPEEAAMPEQAFAPPMEPEEVVEDMSQAKTDALEPEGAPPMAAMDAAPPPMHDATMIDPAFAEPEKPAYPIFGSAPKEPEPLYPSSQPSPLPSYAMGGGDAGKTMVESEPMAQASPPPPQGMPMYGGQSSPPPPPPVDSGPAGAGNNRNRNIMIAVVAIVLLCCCCLALGYIGWTYGDSILSQISALPNSASPLLNLRA